VLVEVGLEGVADVVVNQAPMYWNAASALGSALPLTPQQLCRLAVGLELVRKPSLLVCCEVSDERRRVATSSKLNVCLDMCYSSC
jgi:hypothetical protein